VLPFGYPRNDVHKSEIVELVRQQRFDELEERIDGLRRAVAEDVRHEARLHALYDALDRDDPMLAAGITAWLAAKPRSANALTARASFYFRAAVRARGTASFANTPVERRRAMREYATLTLRDVDAALAHDSTHLIPYYVALGVTQLQGAHERGRQMLELGLARHPGSYLLRARYMDALRPRWGGSYEAMRALADEALRDTARNPRLATLRGSVLVEQGNTHIRPRPAEGSRAPDYRAAIDSLTRALEYGLSFNALLHRGEAYYRVGEYERAFLDLRQAVIWSPQEAGYLTLYGRTLFQLAHRAEPSVRGLVLERAIEALDLAVHLEPTDRIAVTTLQAARQARGACQRETPPCR
jgi:tetratricopeptide (TPR) repeat protein